MKKMFLLLLLSLVLGTASMNAQVTVGSVQDPAKAALLDIKSQTNLKGGETTSKGGLLLPRVQLQTLNSLRPFIASETATDKLEHIGLEVYNITDNTIFKPGIYYWNGNQWKLLNSTGTAIYLPPFTLDWTSGATNKTVNLYTVYTRNFTTTGQPLISNNSALTTATALTNLLGVAGDYDYVVTDYDTNCITIKSISASGVMTYDCKTTAPTASSYVNIILIKKS
ncbi:hypothetical protein FACS189440_12860 [Bacteroidia bacterium]|nr:hypothetical protein FACS189423_08950 [Bacteroidia bacterium]GHT48681.1 hypothetical protein FACS189440_12860 [Bacteroidia bacterium]